MRRGSGVRLLAWAMGIAVLAFLILPILAIIPLSINGGSFLSYPLDGISLRWYRALFTDGRWTSALANSFIVAGAVTAIATPLGTLAALGLNRMPPAARNAVFLFFLAPMLIPAVVVAVAIYLYFAPLGLINSFAGLIIAHTALAVPFVVIVVHASLKGLDFTVLHAAASLGAPPGKVLRHVLAPMIAPGLAAGAVFAFMTSFDEIVVTLFLVDTSHKTLPVRMFDGVRDELNPGITAVATLLIVSSALLYGCSEWLVRRRSHSGPGTAAD